MHPYVQSFAKDSSPGVATAKAGFPYTEVLPGALRKKIRQGCYGVHTSEVPVQTKPVIPLVPHGQQPNQAPMSSHPIPENGKKFFIWTMGCQMNEADSQKVAAMLQEVGYRKAED